MNQSKKIVVLDPGHGGHDTGAVGYGLHESERALDVVLRIEKLLRPYVTVILTRRTDKFIELRTRAEVANINKANAFISYHFNSGDSPSTKLSYEVFSTNGQNNSDKLAERIIQRISEVCTWQTLRSDTSDGDRDKEANFAVIRIANCPAVLVEGEFIHTKHGAESISNEHHQQKRAIATAMGILDFLNVKYTIEK